MNITDLSQALQIFAQYDDLATISAEHDIIYLGSVVLLKCDMDEQHLQTLEDLNWTWDNEYECWRHFV